MANTTYRDVADTCAGCHKPVRTWPMPTTAVPLQHIWYHPACVPACRSCGRSLAAADEDSWMFQGEAVAVRSGYAVQPTSHCCRRCWEAALLDDPPALD